METFITQTQRLIDRVIADPDPIDPYRFGGVSYAPPILDRVMRTPQDVVRVIRQAKVVRLMETADIVERSGVSLAEVEEFEREGTGTTEALFQVMEALGINPVTIPYLT